MKKEYILFIDSGVGGLSTLAEAIKLSPNNFIYFADNLHMPYGNCSDETIFENLKSIICRVEKNYNLKLVVLACNTATTSSIKKLREAFSNLVFVGTEPAIKLSERSGSKNAVCLATPTTAREPRFEELKNNSNLKVTTVSLSSLALDIDRLLTYGGFFCRLNLMRDICQILKIIKQYDGIILGCTHYIFIKDILFLHTGLPVYDGNFGVAKQILKLSETKNNDYSVKFMFSKPKSGLSQKYRKILSQILAMNQKLC